MFTHAERKIFSYKKDFVITYDSTLEYSAYRGSHQHWPLLESPAPCKEFRIPGKFCFWNPESLALESGIQLKESGISVTTEIQIPSTTDKKSGIQYSRIPWHGIQSPSLSVRIVWKTQYFFLCPTLAWHGDYHIFHIHLPSSKYTILFFLFLTLTIFHQLW